MKYLIVAVVASAITLFALQNTSPTSVRFLIWTVPAPLATVILISVGSGVVLAGLPLWINGWRWRARTRALERRLAKVGISVTEGEVPPASAESS